MDTENWSYTRIVLVGGTGAGKSSTGNTICGRRVFTTDGLFSCGTATTKLDDQRLSIVDTPGLFDPNKSKEDVEREIANGVALAAPGPHVFLVVINPVETAYGREEVFRIIQRMFGEWSLRYTMVLFTHGDGLEHGKTVEEFIELSQDLRAFVHQCGGYHVFNNRERNRFQVRDLIEKINTMVKRNGESFYIKDWKHKCLYLFANAVGFGYSIGVASGGSAVEVAVLSSAVGAMIAAIGGNKAVAIVVAVAVAVGVLAYVIGAEVGFAVTAGAAVAAGAGIAGEAFTAFGPETAVNSGMGAVCGATFGASFAAPFPRAAIHDYFIVFAFYGLIFAICSSIGGIFSRKIGRFAAVFGAVVGAAVGASAAVLGAKGFAVGAIISVACQAVILW